MALAQTVLRGPSPLSIAERELIGAWVSVGNHCEYCSRTHGEAARVLLGDNGFWADEVFEGTIPPSASELLKGLLALAEQVRQGNSRGDEVLITRLKGLGADDQMIHDTVLIASSFCLFNRYVDGLATTRPATLDYPVIGRRLAAQGYSS